VEIIDVEPFAGEGSTRSPEDHLLSCLQLITHLHGLPCNTESVLAGLPLVKGLLTLNCLCALLTGLAWL